MIVTPFNLSPFTLTIIKIDLVVRIGAVFHQCALGLVSKQRHFGRLGAHYIDKLAHILVPLPVATRKVVVRIASMQIEAVMFGRGTGPIMGGVMGTENFNL